MIRIAPLPPAIREVAAALEAGGRDAWLVGESLHDWLLHVTPSVWSLATSASAAEIARLFPRAVPVRPDAASCALPTRAGPVHLSSHRRGARVEDDLAHRDFSVLAMALAATSERLLDPHGGGPDLENLRLRSVGDAGERLREDPLRLLRAARLVASHGYEAMPDLEEALAKQAHAAARLPAADARREISLLLLGAHAGAGLELLRRSGVEAALVPGVAPEAGRWVQCLPRQLAPRLAAWLRGAHPGHSLHRLRFSPELRERVLGLLQLHPVEQTVSLARHSSLRRFLERTPGRDIEVLFRLRACELSLHADPPAELAKLAALESALHRLAAQVAREETRPRLALAGSDVMAILGRGPGPQVGLALRHLQSCAEADPACNEREALTSRLRAWAAEREERTS